MFDCTWFIQGGKFFQFNLPVDIFVFTVIVVVLSAYRAHRRGMRFLDAIWIQQLWLLVPIYIFFTTAGATPEIAIVWITIAYSISEGIIVGMIIALIRVTYAACKKFSI